MKSPQNGAEHFYLEVLRRQLKGDPTFPEPSYFDLKADEHEAILEAVAENRPVVLRFVTEDDIPAGVEFEAASSVIGDQTSMFFTRGKIKQGARATYTGADLIARFSADARARAERIASNLGLDVSMRSTGAMFALAMLYRFLQVRAPRWLEAISMSIDSSMTVDDEIALAYAGAFVAYEAELATALMIDQLTGIDRSEYEARVRADLTPEEAQIITGALGLRLAPQDLNSVTPEIWAQIIKRSATFVTAKKRENHESIH